MAEPISNEVIAPAQGEPGQTGTGFAAAAGGKGARLRGISFWTCAAIVVANMVGTGVFTSIGHQAGPLPSGFAIIFLWLLGGIAAFCGAMGYAELAGAIPRSGGEYHFLSRIYHPAFGTAAGVVSATVGFSAPTALAAFAFGGYFNAVFPATEPRVAALVIVVLVTCAHLISLRVGSAFQNTFTLLKLALITFLIVYGLFFAEHQPITFLPQEGDSGLIWSGAFAISLVFVNYAYSGWNAATYVVDEVQDSGRAVARALLLGTALVTLIYVLLNAVFLLVAPISELAQSGETGAYVAAAHMFGNVGGRIISAFICLGLISTISAMTWAGPRVLQVMGEDLPVLQALGERTKGDIPARAILFQLGIVIILVTTGSFKSVLNYVECLLMFCASATVLGVIILRIREPNLPRPFRCWGYPFTPLLFIAVDLWTLYYLGKMHPMETALGAATLLIGVILYYTSRRREPQPAPPLPHN